MKKVLALVLASLLTISLAGCNDSKTNTFVYNQTELFI